MYVLQLHNQSLAGPKFRCNVSLRPKKTAAPGVAQTRFSSSIRKDPQCVWVPRRIIINHRNNRHRELLPRREVLYFFFSRLNNNKNIITIIMIRASRTPRALCMVYSNSLGLPAYIITRAPSPLPTVDMFGLSFSAHPLSAGLETRRRRHNPFVLHTLFHAVRTRDYKVVNFLAPYMHNGTISMHNTILHK